MDKLFRNECRRRVQEVNPKLDEVSFVKIMEEAQDVYELCLINSACRRQIHQEHPDLDEFGVDEFMKFIPFPPILMVVSALAERMHISEEERKQQVATMMARKVCSVPKKMNPSPDIGAH